jgi:hypothetical protein
VSIDGSNSKTNLFAVELRPCRFRCVERKGWGGGFRGGECALFRAKASQPIQHLIFFPLGLPTSSHFVLGILNFPQYSGSWELQFFSSAIFCPGLTSLPMWGMIGR